MLEWESIREFLCVMAFGTPIMCEFGAKLTFVRSIVAVDTEFLRHSCEAENLFFAFGVAFCASQRLMPPGQSKSCF
jgi:hypothetical protein